MFYLLFICSHILSQKVNFIDIFTGKIFWILESEKVPKFGNLGIISGLKVIFLHHTAAIQHSSVKLLITQFN